MVTVSVEFPVPAVLVSGEMTEVEADESASVEPHKQLVVIRNDAWVL
jgi:hypothetical protein